ncbi:hypothetical protein C2E23DRAFT_493745 [Lenzites betulinus]|nr:hypothetical protein C2E23DRAFT_493745 [Lenzites betulinus]
MLVTADSACICTWANRFSNCLAPSPPCLERTELLHGHSPPLPARVSHASRYFRGSFGAYDDSLDGGMGSSNRSLEPARLRLQYHPVGHALKPRLCLPCSNFRRLGPSLCVKHPSRGIELDLFQLCCGLRSLALAHCLRLLQPLLKSILCIAQATLPATGIVELTSCSSRAATVAALLNEGDSPDSASDYLEHADAVRENDAFWDART